MRKIKYYNRDPFKFHKSIVNLQKNRQTKETLQDVESILKDTFNNYQTSFTNNQLEVIQPIAQLPPNAKKNLKDLYNPQRKYLQNLLIELTTNERGAKDICPYCTIAIEVNELDHYIPKSQFPEFSVNPLNLVPCCSTCNKKKSNRWLDNNSRVFLNLFTDNIPCEQYLFVSITSSEADKIPKVVFFLENRGIDPNVYHLIESHYKHLDLCKRFSEQSGNVIEEVRRTISTLGTDNDLFTDMLHRIIERYKNEFGNNYWKAILLTKYREEQDLLNNLRAIPI